MRSLAAVLFSAAVLTHTAAHPSHHHAHAHDELPPDPVPFHQLPLSKQQVIQLGNKGQLDDEYFGIRTFAGLPPIRCWGKDKDVPFDLAIIGAPFDTTTSYRPGARFGPNGIRQGSGRIHAKWAYNPEIKINAWDSFTAVDCGDVRMTYVDNEVALQALEDSYKELISREVTFANPNSLSKLAKDGKHHPRIVTLGGDHSVLLPILRAQASVYGSVSVIHFDSHMDTWPGGSLNAKITHGSMLWHAAHEGLVNNGSSIHAGLRSPLRSADDYKVDDHVGFHRVEAWELDRIGVEGVVQRIIDVVGDNACYLSIDIDVIDPAFAPATGTPEPGGWTTRELKQILHGMRKLNIVGADVVEVAPAYDGQAEETVIAAAYVISQVVGLFAMHDLGM